jgi:hypothetical protein
MVIIPAFCKSAGRAEFGKNAAAPAKRRFRRVMAILDYPADV